jgi:AcrR family transcriptional regulator
MDDGGTGLPASFEQAWGVRQRPTKGPKRGLSLERIVDAAVKIAGADGLAAVSMSRVAADLGASTMSLYRYVAAKDELLALMLDAVTGTPPDVPAPGEDWRAGLARWAFAERAALRQHPWALRVPLTGPPATPNQIAWLERGLRCLRGTGLAEAEKLGVVILLSSYVWREVMIAVDISAAGSAGGLVPPSPAGYGRALAKLTDPERFPALHALLASGVFEQADDPDDLDAEFDFGLQRILDGIEVLVRSRR